jgi:DMSO/TMAO reductase YedYZ molybdopterin-dependent catalytic subunit
VARLITRRELLAGIGAASLLAGCDSPHRMGALLTNGMLRWNEHFESSLFSPSRLAPESPPEDLTPEQQFPSYFKSDKVPLPPAGWSLKVGGMVARPSVFTLEQLKAMPRMDLRLRQYCVNGWSAVAAWHGVSLSEVARTVGADPRAPYVEFRSFDAGYWSSWDRASALHPQTILAYGMNGHLLHPDHGAPLRLYSAVKLGYKMVKYLTEINFLPYRTGGTCENNGSEWFAGV